TNSDEHHDCRVRQSAFELAHQLGPLFDVDRKAVHDGVENTTHLTSIDQIHKQVVKHRRVTLEGIAECRTLFNLALDVRNDTLEKRVRLLARQNVETADNREARVDHCREETREGHHLLDLHGAPTDLETSQG